jgi:hypothetical protein
MLESVAFAHTRMPFPLCEGGSAIVGHMLQSHADALWPRIGRARTSRDRLQYWHLCAAHTLRHFAFQGVEPSRGQACTILLVHNLGTGNSAVRISMQDFYAGECLEKAL